MELLVLAPFADEPTTRLLVAAAARLGLDARLETADGDLLPGDPSSACPLLPRVGFRRLRAGIRALRRHERGGALPLNPSAAILRAKNKRFLGDAAASGLPRPVARVARAGSPLPPDFPFPGVVKPLHGARGEGIALLPNSEAWAALPGRGRRLVEAFVDPAARREYRLLLLRGDLVAATERFPAPGDFRGNRAAGGREAPAVPPPAAVEAARAAAAWYRLGLCGVDVVVPESLPDTALVLDVNDSPGLVGISRTTGRDLASEILVRWLRPPAP